MSYRLAPRAIADVEGIGDYISQESPQAAVRLIQRFARHWELLASQPYSGATREDVLPDLRHLVMGEYIAFYRVVGRDVLILRVLHGRRDITGDDIAS
ncbi:type II toxin-antitoxin system RelE/ParE family toxin [Mesorhizobium sp. ANAO-SY3R2]|uniref:type II toxin-antitoxin system RelE/ParE family toxin n=1 Tax=Mesorhizobium sp. ANAO-SY3R2 TaxID=3166644 RepID=UPI00366AC0F6